MAKKPQLDMGLETKKVPKEKKRGRRPYNARANWEKFYRLGPDTFVLFKYNQGPTLRACPSSLRGLLQKEEPIAHLHYEGTKAGRAKEGFVTAYLVDSPTETLLQTVRQAGKVPDIRTASFQASPEFMRAYHVEGSHIPLGKLTTSFLDASLDDIVEFCNRQPAKEPAPVSGLQEVARIPIDPRYTLVTPNKNDAVRWGKGQFGDPCIIDLGLDQALGCPNNITPDGFYEPEELCGYCYAFQNGPSFLDTLFNFDVPELLERFQKKVADLSQKEGNERLKQGGPVHFRIGQLTDGATPPTLKKFPGFRDNLAIMLEALVKYRETRDSAATFPTKLLAFDEDYVPLLKKGNVSVMYSFGVESLETGAVRHDFGFDRRAEEALRYADAGVKTGFYIAANIAEDAEQMHPDARRMFEFYQKHDDKMVVQFLDFRVTKKMIAKAITGHSWNELLANGQDSMFGGCCTGAWHKTGQNYLAATHTHPSWFRLVGENKGRVRLCSTHVVPEERRCGECYMEE